MQVVGAAEAPLALCPLAETARRLSALDEHLSYEVGLPDGNRWYRLAELADAKRLAAWHGELTAREGDRRTAAAYLGGWIAAAAVQVWAVPVFAERRLALAGPEAVSVRRHADGWFDAVAAPGSPLAILPHDPAAELPGAVVVPDVERLLDLLAERLLSIEGVFESLRAECPVGPPALWGVLADSVAATALWLARLTDGDRHAAWRDAEALTDRLAARQDRLRIRPNPFPVAFSGGEELYHVRGTCCLSYRTVEGADPDAEGYCSTCPLRTHASRTHRLRAYLEDRLAT